MNGTDALVQHGWRYFRHEPGSAYLLDAASGYLGHLPGPVPFDASALHLSVAQPRIAELAATPSVSGGTSVYELQLALLGGRVLVRFTHERCRAEVARYFSCSHDPSGTTPDVIIECDLPSADRYLFRARPADQYGLPLEGIRAWPAGAAAPHAWTSAQPPLPPLALSPFKDRFIALHAATLRTPDGGGITVVGHRNSGKSSSTLHLGRQEGFEFLADETTFVHLRTAVAEPFPQSVGVWRSDGEKQPVSAAELYPRIGARPALIDQVVFLDPCDSAALAGPLAPAETFRSLLPHHRDASASLDESIVTLDHIARSVTAVRLRYRDRTDLNRLLDEIIQGRSAR